MPINEAYWEEGEIKRNKSVMPTGREVDKIQQLSLKHAFTITNEVQLFLLSSGIDSVLHIPPWDENCFSFWTSPPYLICYHYSLKSHIYVPRNRSHIYQSEKKIFGPCIKCIYFIWAKLLTIIHYTEHRKSIMPILQQFLNKLSESVPSWMFSIHRLALNFVPWNNCCSIM